MTGKVPCEAASSMDVKEEVSLGFALPTLSRIKRADCEWMRRKSVPAHADETDKAVLAWFPFHARRYSY